MKLVGLLSSFVDRISREFSFLFGLKVLFCDLRLLVRVLHHWVNKQEII